MSEGSGDISLGVVCGNAITHALSWSLLSAVSMLYQVQNCFLLPCLKSPVNSLMLRDAGLDPKLLWAKDFSKRILVKVLFEGFVESVSLLPPPSQQCGQGCGDPVGRSWSAVPRDGAAHPPPPVHTFLSCP